LIGLLIALLAAGSQWLTQGEKRAPSPETAAPGEEPDYFLENFALTTLNAEGAPQRRLTGERLVHFGPDNSKRIQQPHLRLYQMEGPPWHLRAETGTISGDNETVWLEGSVRLDRRPAGGLLQMTTDRLLLRPAARYAETDAPVRFRDPRARMEGIGMQAYLQEERLILLSEVRGIYEMAK